MAGKNTAVFGIYPNRTSVEEAVDHLRAAGFRSTDVSVLFSDNQGTKDFAHEKNTKAPEGAATGVSQAKACSSCCSASRSLSLAGSIPHRATRRNS